jgi:hypothetical protein
MGNTLAFIPIVLGLLVMVLTIPMVVLRVTQPGPVNVSSQAAKATETSVSFFPPKGDYQLSANPMGVSVIVESAVKPVGNVELVISYNATLVEITGLAPGIIFDSYPVVRVDNSVGKIYLTMVNRSPKPVTGIVASFKLVPKNRGNIVLNFEKNAGADVATSATYLFK